MPHYRRTHIVLSVIAATSLAIIPVGQSAIASPQPVPAPDIWEPPVGVLPENLTPDAPEDVAWTDPLSGSTVDDRARAAAASPKLGALPYYAMQKFNLSVDTAAQVNLANGNLIVSAQDLKIQSPGIPITVNRYYNSQEPGMNGALRGGWRFSNEIGLSDTLIDEEGALSEELTFTGPSGFKTKFNRDHVDEWEDTYTTEPGFKADLRATNVDRFFEYDVEYHSSGEKLHFNAGGFLTQHTDRNGVGVAYQYNPTRTLKSINGNRAVFTYNSNNKVTKLTDLSGRETLYSGTTSLDSVTKPDTSVTSYTYDSSNRLKTVVLPGFGTSTKTVTFTYDTSNRLKTVSEQRFSSTWGAESAAVTTFTYNSGNTVVTDPRGNASTFNLDSEGRVTSAKDPLNRTRAQEWTANSDIQSTTDAFASSSTPGNQTTAEYDEMNRQTSTTMPTGAATQAIYAQGANCPTAKTGTERQVLCSVDSSGSRSSNTYDAAGNLTKQSDSTSTETTTHTYTRENDLGSICGGRKGQICSSKDGKDNVTSYQYDTAGNVTRTTPPAPLGQTINTYDALNRLKTTTDGNGDVTTYSYDVQDRLTVTKYDDGSEVRTAWNKNGTKSTEFDTASNKTISYQYDSLGNQTQKTLSGTTANKLRYDAVGNLTSYEDSSGVTTYTYDSANQLTSMRQPGGTCPTSGNPLPNAKCTLFSYNANGLESARIFPGGARQDTTRDASGRPTKIAAKDGSGVVRVEIDYGYALNGVDNAVIRSRTSVKEEGIPAGAITTYGYDSQTRLTDATERTGTATNASWTYTYDNAGNRTTQTRTGSTGAPAGTTTYSYNAANQLTGTTSDTTTWTYDGAGNQTRNGITGVTNIYGVRLETLTQGSTTYTSFGQGNTEQLTAGSTSYTNSPLGLSQKAIGTATTNYSRTSDGKSVAAQSAATGNIYYVTDALGSAVGIFTSTGSWAGGYSYSPFGETRSVASGTPQTTNLRYISGYWESGSLYKLGARYYDSSLGRFTQMDPSGQEEHPWVYAKNNPISMSDFTGLDATSDGAAELGGEVAGTGVQVLGIGLMAAIGGPVGLGVGIGFGIIGGTIGGGLTAQWQGKSPTQVRDAALEGGLKSGIAGLVEPR